MTTLGKFPYLVSFAAGLLTFASPCVLPLIPIYISFITGVSVSELKGAEGSALLKTFLNALAFVIGFSAVFVLLGASASYFGALLGTHKALIRWVGGIAVIIFGIHLSGVYRIKFLYAEKRLDAGKFSGGYLGSFLIGLAFAAGWTPCIGPVLSSILILASAQGTIYKGMLLLFLYSFGNGYSFSSNSTFC